MDTPVTIPDADRQRAAVLVSELKTLLLDGLEEQYELRNLSEDPCKVPFKGVSCGCSGLYAGGRLLQPDEQWTLTPHAATAVKLTSRVARKPGAYSYFATFTTPLADGSPTELTLRCGLKVVADIVLAPEVLSHDFVKPGSTAATKSLLVERRWRASLPAPSPPVIPHLPSLLRVVHIAEKQPPTELETGIPTRSWELTFEISPPRGPASEPFQGILPVVFRDGPESEPLQADLPALVRLACGIEAPKISHFGRVQPGGQLTRRVLLRAADQAEFSVLKTSSTSPAFSVPKHLTRRGRVCWLDLQFQPPVPGEYEGEVVIQTDHPTTEEVRIAVSGKAPTPGS